MSLLGRDRRWSTHVVAVPFWVAVSSSLGCLADPPTFAPRGQVPPFIIAGQVDPPLGSIYVGPPGDTVDVNVPFRSEDVNTNLGATLYLDLVPGAGPAGAYVYAFGTVPAGNYEELRWVSLRTQRIQEPGCHSLTLIMTYVDNLNPLRNNLPSDDTLAARVVWWLDIGDDDGETMLSDCPGASPLDAVPSGG